MADQKKIERLAEIKSVMKGLETEAKKLQTEILAEPDSAQNFETKHGTLVHSERSTYDSIDNEEFINKIGIDSFRQAATVTVSGVKKAFGIVGVNELDAHGLLTVKSVSEYYSLRK